MATTSLTPNLKLRVSSDLTSDSRYNLNRIDTLASLYQVDTTETAKVRSKTDILFQPNDPDIGGTGTGGTVQFGTTDQPITELQINAGLVSLSSGLLFSDQATGGTKNLQLQYKSDINGSTDTGANRVLNIDLDSSDRDLVLGGDFKLLGNSLALTLSNAISWTLPSGNGSNGQVLQTDGAGVLSWTSVSAAAQQLVTTWTMGEGASKTVTHNFGTRYIMVQVLDTGDSYKTIEMETVERPTDNTIVLTSSIAPSSTWTVLLQQVS